MFNRLAIKNIINDIFKHVDVKILSNGAILARYYECYEQVNKIWLLVNDDYSLEFTFLDYTAKFKCNSQQELEELIKALKSEYIDNEDQDWARSVIVNAMTYG